MRSEGECMFQSRKSSRNTHRSGFLSPTWRHHSDFEADGVHLRFRADNNDFAHIASPIHAIRTSLTAGLQNKQGKLRPSIHSAKVNEQLRRYTSNASSPYGTGLPGFPADGREAALSPLIDTTEKSEKKEEDSGNVTLAFVYGLINFVCTLPILVAYTHIVFTDQKLFGPFMPLLLKTMFLSCALHQLAFSIWSNMTFAVGQVQDVGLIFLAAMVKSITSLARQPQYDLSPEEIVATALWTGAISTLGTGLLVYMVGWLQLVDYVSLLPLPVIGGYLGYIGWFCFAAGLGIVSGEQIGDPTTLPLLLQWELVPKLGVFVLMLCVVLFVHYKVKHIVAMPLVLLVLPTAFFVYVKFLTDFTLEELRETEWLPVPSKNPAWGLLAWQLYDPSLVCWWLVPQQIFNFIGLFTVVTFGSSLDIAAIQADIQEIRLDFNAEMKTVGKSNILSGIFGGFTGSYIFSQTVFSLKSNVTSRVNGLVVFFLEFVLYIVPLDATQVLPNPYVAAITALFGIDIMKDWLFSSRALLSDLEYKLLWVSFLCVMVLAGYSSFGVIEGMVLATVLAAMLFASLYAGLRVWRRIPTIESSVVRKYDERMVIQKYSAKQIYCARFRGYVFFGSSLDISAGLLQDILGGGEQQLPPVMMNSEDLSRQASGQPNGTTTTTSTSAAVKGGQLQQPLLDGYNNYLRASGESSPGVINSRLSPRSTVHTNKTGRTNPTFGSTRLTTPAPIVTATSPRSTGHPAPSVATQVGGDDFRLRPSGLGVDHDVKYVILDFTHVDGIDSTAASSLASLKTSLFTHGIDLLFCSIMNDQVRSMLDSHGVLGGGEEDEEGDEENVENIYDIPEPCDFLTLDDALQHCETLILQHAEYSKRLSRRSRKDEEMPLGELLFSYYIEDPSFYRPTGFVTTSNNPRESGDGSDTELQRTLHAAIKKVEPAFVRHQLAPGEILFKHDDIVDRIFFITGGAVSTFQWINQSINKIGPDSLRTTPRVPSPEEQRLRNRPEATHTQGAVLGSISYFHPDKVYGFDATAMNSGAVVYSLKHDVLHEFEKTDPEVGFFLYKVLMQDTSAYALRQVHSVPLL